MKLEPALAASLSAVIGHDLEAIGRMADQLDAIAADGAWRSPGSRDLMAVGYLLHNIYNALENSFEQVSRACENHVTDPGQWHKELLGKMFLDIPGVRPALLPASLRGTLNDLRGFRHIFRHSYDFELDPEKSGLLLKRWGHARKELTASLQSFRQLLTAPGKVTGDG